MKPAVLYTGISDASNWILEPVGASGIKPRFSSRGVPYGVAPGSGVQEASIQASR